MRHGQRLIPSRRNAKIVGYAPSLGWKITPELEALVAAFESPVDAAWKRALMADYPGERRAGMLRSTRFGQWVCSGDHLAWGMDAKGLSLEKIRQQTEQHCRDEALASGAMPSEFRAASWIYSLCMEGPGTGPIVVEARLI